MNEHGAASHKVSIGVYHSSALKIYHGEQSTLPVQLFKLANRAIYYQPPLRPPSIKIYLAITRTKHIVGRYKYKYYI